MKLQAMERHDEIKAYLREIYDRRGNFVGYTEKVSKDEYNHYDQDFNFLASTSDGDYDFSVKDLDEEE